MFCSERTNKDFTNDIKTDFNLEDLNFDPAAIMGDNNGDWSVSNSTLYIYTLHISELIKHSI